MYDTRSQSEAVLRLAFYSFEFLILMMNVSRHLLLKPHVLL